METPTFHKVSHAVAQKGTLTHRHTTGHWDSLVIYEGIFIDGLYDQFEWYLWGQSVSVLDHWLSIRAIPAVHCSAQTKQEKERMNKTVWCVMSCSSSDMPFLNLEQRTVWGFWMSQLLLQNYFTLLGNELLWLWTDNGGRRTVPRCVVCGTFSAWGETAAELLGFNSTNTQRSRLFFFQEFLAQCRAITLTRVYALCNSKHP